MRCPKCGAEQADGEECVRCGVVFAKLRPRTPDVAPPAAPQAAQPAAPKSPPPNQAAKPLRSLRELLRTATPDTAQRITFFSQMARLTGASVPVPEALAHVEAILGARTLGRAAAAMRTEIAAGSRLSEAMARRPWLFDGLEVALIEGVEPTGRLQVACAQLQGRLESQKEVQHALITSFGYPLLVALTACITAPVPRYLTAGAAAYAASLAGNLMILGTFIGTVFFLVPAIARHPKVSPRLLALGAKLPMASSLVLKRRFWLVFDAMTRALGAGISPREAMRLATSATGEPCVSAAGTRATEAFQGGESFSGAFGLLPGIDRETLAVLAAAERSATLRQTFEEQAAEKRAAYNRQLGGVRTAIRVGISTLLALAIGYDLIQQIRAGIADPLAGLSAEDQSEASRAFKQLSPADMSDAEHMLKQLLPPDAAP